MCVHDSKGRMAAYNGERLHKHEGDTITPNETLMAQLL